MNFCFLPSFNIFENLAIESYLLREKKEDYILVWRSGPSVVFGKFQNPWIECNIPYCKENKINIARRESGGGCVFHDEGNLNISIINSSNDLFVKPQFDLFLDFLRSYDLNISSNNRHDLLIDEKLKITGSAFKKIKGRQLHHFTFLIDSNREMLSKSLKSNLTYLETKSLPSRPTSIVQLSELKSDMMIDQFLKNFHFFLKERFEEFFFSENISDKALLLSSENWVFGETPHFSLDYKEKILTIKKGIVSIGELKFNLFDDQDKQMLDLYQYLMGYTARATT